MSRRNDILAAIEKVRALAEAVRPLQDPMLDNLVDRAHRELLNVLKSLDAGSACEPAACAG